MQAQIHPHKEVNVIWCDRKSARCGTLTQPRAKSQDNECRTEEGAGEVTVLSGIGDEEICPGCERDFLALRPENG